MGPWLSHLPTTPIPPAMGPWQSHTTTTPIPPVMGPAMAKPHTHHPHPSSHGPMAKPHPHYTPPPRHGAMAKPHAPTTHHPSHQKWEVQWPCLMGQCLMGWYIYTYEAQPHAIYIYIYICTYGAQPHEWGHGGATHPLPPSPPKPYQRRCTHAAAHFPRKLPAAALCH